MASLLSTVLHSLLRCTNERLKPLNITFAQCGVLMFLREQGSARVGQLAGALDMDSGALTRLLERLESKGLCARKREGPDRRVVKLTLSLEGRRVAERIAPVLQDVLDLHFRDIEPRQRKALAAQLRLMLASASAPVGLLASDSSRSLRCVD